MNNRRQSFILKAIHFINNGGKGITIPFLPLFLMYRGFNSVEIGMIMGVAPIVSIIAQPLIGYISDKYKTIKKILIILNIIVFATGFGIFFSEQFVIVFSSVILMHFTLSPATPLIDSMTLHALGEKNRQDYGRIRLWGSVGFCIISLVSGPILFSIGIDKIAILFWFACLVTIAIFLFIEESNETTEPVNLKAVGQVFRNFAFVWALFLSLIIMIPHRVNDTMIALRLEQLGGSEWMIGLAWALCSVSEVPVFYYLSRKIAQYKDLFLLCIVAILYMFRWFFSAIIESAWMLTFLQLSHGITFALFWLVAMQLAVRSVPDHLRSTGQAVLGSICFGLGGAIGGTSGGWVFDHLGASTMYYMMSALTLVAVVLLFISHIVKERQ